MTTLASGCPGSQVRRIEPKETSENKTAGRGSSELRQWPTPLHRGAAERTPAARCRLYSLRLWRVSPRLHQGQGGGQCLSKTG